MLPPGLFIATVMLILVSISLSPALPVRVPHNVGRPKFQIEPPSKSSHEGAPKGNDFD